MTKITSLGNAHDDHHTCAYIPVAVAVLLDHEISTGLVLTSPVLVYIAPETRSDLMVPVRTQVRVPQGLREEAIPLNIDHINQYDHGTAGDVTQEESTTQVNIALTSSVMVT